MKASIRSTGTRRPTALAAFVGLTALCLVEPSVAAAQEPIPQEPIPQEPIPEEPTFTPFTVAPRILNRDDIVDALRSAYPTRLRETGIGGTVDVWFFIDDQGRVARRMINQSSGVEELDQAALEVAGTFRFAPAMNRERQVGVWVSLPISFDPPSDPRTD